MFKLVVLPLDESEISEAALPYAVSITDPHGKLVLVSAVERLGHHSTNAGLYHVPIDYGNIHENMLEHANAYLDTKLREARQHVPASIKRVISGEPASGIIQVAEEEKAEAIVMSTHGRSGISRWVFGSITQKVLSAAPCPVLVVPPAKR
ncbi:MAG: universal stress protein [Anaerolineales bacterium]